MQAYVHTRNVEYEDSRHLFVRMKIPYWTRGTSYLNGNRIRVFFIHYYSEEQLTVMKLAMDCKIKDTSVISHYEETV